MAEFSVTSGSCTPRGPGGRHLARRGTKGYQSPDAQESDLLRVREVVYPTCERFPCERTGERTCERFPGEATVLTYAGNADGRGLGSFDPTGPLAAPTSRRPSR